MVDKFTDNIAFSDIKTINDGNFLRAIIKTKSLSNRMTEDFIDVDWRVYSNLDALSTDGIQQDNELKRKKIRTDAKASGSKDATQMEIDDDHIAIDIRDVKETTEEEGEDVTTNVRKAEEAAEVKNQDQEMTIDINDSAERVIQDEKKAEEVGEVSESRININDEEPPLPKDEDEEPGCLASCIGNVFTK
ncbi:hypothetical protein L1887_25374 [Cichorium endivia]|nr:hypothetical protein L1887_25374 [Cichorium endivia]